MICKNCSAPYHGYRTCPHPANLNVMMQLYLEFCMQQLQHFQPEVEFQQWLANTTSTRDTNVPQPLVGSPTPTTSKNKMGKRKNPTKNKELNINIPKKKRKLSVTKKYENNDDESDSSSDSDEDSTSTDSDSSSEGFQQQPSTSANGSNKRFKNKSSKLSALNVSNFLPNNPVSFPLALNTGIPNLPNVTNQHLNNLLLSQMFQNAIGTMTKKKRN